MREFVLMHPEFATAMVYSVAASAKEIAKICSGKENPPQSIAPGCALIIAVGGLMKTGVRFVSSKNEQDPKRGTL